jgi:hypothetical protein
MALLFTQEMSQMMESGAAHLLISAEPKVYTITLHAPVSYIANVHKNYSSLEIIGDTLMASWIPVYDDEQG